MQVKPNQGIILCWQHKGVCTCFTLHFISPQTTSGCMPRILVFLIACLVSASWPIISFLGCPCPFSLVPSPTSGVFIVHACHGVLQNICTIHADVLMPELCAFILLHLSTRILISDDWVPMKLFQSKGYRLTNVHQRFKNSMIWWWTWYGTT